MGFFNFNGKLFTASTPVVGPDNRGLRYGDGLFETMRSHNNELILFDEHLARLWKGLQLLQFEIPRFFTPDKLQEEIIFLLKKNKYTNARIRLSVIRGDGGLYDHINSLQYIIQCWPLTSTISLLNENGLQLGIYRDAKKVIDSFSNCKHNNYLPYVMAALFAKQNKYNDALLLNQYDRVCDSTIANVFSIKNEILSTPPLSEGCIAGIMRKTIMQTLSENDIPIIEEVITEEKLMDADEVFLTNSISNMRWIAGIGDKAYTNRFSRDVYHLLSKTIPDIFC